MTRLECLNILELPANASRDDIVTAYRHLVQVWHPDRFQNNPELAQKANVRLAAINEAYNNLIEGKFTSDDLVTPHRDEQVRYLGNDPRLKLPRDEAQAIVEVSDEGMTLVTLIKSQADDGESRKREPTHLEADLQPHTKGKAMVHFQPEFETHDRMRDISILFCGYLEDSQRLPLSENRSNLWQNRHYHFFSSLVEGGIRDEKRAIEFSAGRASNVSIMQVRCQYRKNHCPHRMLSSVSVHEIPILTRPGNTEKLQMW